MVTRNTKPTSQNPVRCRPGRAGGPDGLTGLWTTGVIADMENSFTSGPVQHHLRTVIYANENYC
jgi:hypothetical protein